MAVVITGSNTPTAGGITYGDGTTYATTTAGTSGQPVVSGGAGAPAFRPYTLPASDGSASQVLQTNGSGALSFATPSSGLSAATQAQMEAASSNTVAATPLNTNWHPGVAKVWIKCDSSGTIQASHNVTSITDIGTGEVTVTIATDFSSADYAIVTGVCASNGVAGSAKSVRFSNSIQPTAGSFTARYGDDITGNADPIFWFFSCFGDQA